MPIYEYSCTQCHQTEEIMQKVGEDNPKLCSKCGAADSLVKVVSATSFQLKGGGWYKDLYASPKPDNAQQAKAKTNKDQKD